MDDSPELIFTGGSVFTADEANHTTVAVKGVGSPP